MSFGYNKYKQGLDISSMLSREINGTLDSSATLTAHTVDLLETIKPSSVYNRNNNQHVHMGTPTKNTVVLKWEREVLPRSSAGVSTIVES